jgi:hypothetical protein
MALALCALLLVCPVHAHHPSKADLAKAKKKLEKEKQDKKGDKDKHSSKDEDKDKHSSKDEDQDKHSSKDEEDAKVCVCVRGSFVTVQRLTESLVVCPVGSQGRP